MNEHREEGIEKLIYEFENPSAEFSPMPFWFWNDTLTEEELSRQIYAFKEKGVDGFVIHPRIGLDPEIVYMGETWLSYVRFAVELAKKLDMKVILYDEAISTFGSGQYVSCIENCRSLFESFFKKLDTVHNDYIKGILTATGETIIDNGAQLTSIKKIYTYWIDNKKGANRFRLFQTMYSVMSGLGTHHEDVASKEDALLLLRYVEDCLLWCFRKGINC